MEEKIDRLIETVGDVRTMLAEQKIITEGQAEDITRNHRAYRELEKRVEGLEHWQMRVKERFFVYGTVGVAAYTLLNKIGAFDFIGNLIGGK